MVSADLIREASKVTFAYGCAFVFNIFVQSRTKFAAMKAHREAKKAGSKEQFNRYDNDSMIAADRCVGNFIEWQGLFLSLFWTNAVLTGKELWLGWAYVGIRVLYPFLAINGGITKAGPKH